jgi:hypothetical protein
VRVAANYNNAIAGINLTPSVAWSHDVRLLTGTELRRGPHGAEPRTAADYLNVYQAELSYTSFFGADYNELQDRDFVSLSVSVAF